MSKITANKENIQKESVSKNSMDAVYSAAELSKESRKIFGIPPEIVQAALKQAHKTKATIAEAKEIVKKFLYKEVK